MRSVGSAVAVAAMTLCAGTSSADVWDTGNNLNDDFFWTNNVLVHGSVQVHDLGVRPGPVADQDWFRPAVTPYSSFEVQIDGMTADLTYGSPALLLERMANDGVTVLGNSRAVDLIDLNKRISVINGTPNLDWAMIRVSRPPCGTDCTTDDQYTIRARETTVNVARFNNSASQTTVLLTQNVSPDSITSYVYFWDVSGSYIDIAALALAPKALSVLPLASLPSLAGRSGSITISHDGPYGGLNVKAVALEPATGMSFDTPGVVRAY